MGPPQQSPFPVEFADVQVTFGGIPAPLIWLQDSQINAAVPWAVAGPTTQVCVAYKNVKTNCLTWPVAETAPGVFTVDGSHAAALNEDGTVNSASNPATPGSIVSVFATGLGPLTPPQRDGSIIGMPLPTNSIPVHLAIVYESLFQGSPRTQLSPYNSIYAGPAPFLIGGTTQINFRAIPDPNTFILSAGDEGGYSYYFHIYVAAP
jgi:uncharacterized protein (TIGR03437 family)